MPAFQNVVVAKGYDCAAAVTKKRLVKFDGTNTFKVTPVTAVTDVPVGVAMFSVSTAEIARGKGASVHTEGIALMEASEAINEGQLVSPQTDGRAQVAASTERVIGHAVSSCTAAGQEVAVQLNLPGNILA